MLDINEALIEKIKARDRRTLSKVITLIESSKPEHRRLVNTLFQKLLPVSKKSKRIGIAGSPGVGKSTFIEAFGLRLIQAGYSVAIMPIDPSSPISGGSILADKTRMGKLTQQDDAFIRPSPSTLKNGSIHPATFETTLLCEAAGFDYILVETVGVGQSETAIAQCVDMLLVLLHPGGGDDLQGFKRGLLELADLVIVNKADGDLKATAQSTKQQYKSGLHLLKAHHDFWDRQITTCSALHHEGIDQIQRYVDEFFEKAANHLDHLRAKQAQHIFESTLSWRLKEWIQNTPDTFEQVRKSIEQNALSPFQAVDKILEELTKKL